MLASDYKQINSNVTKQPLFEVENFSVSFRTYQKGLRESILNVIKKFDLVINEGEIVAVVGASGSGKSLLANAILNILPENAIVKGTIKYKGEILNQEKQIKLRGKEIMLIPQSTNALDPLMKVGKQVQAVVRSKDKQIIQRKIFRKIGLSEEVEDRYPFELSGGMTRRVLMSTAMASEAKLIIADESTPGLDECALQESLDLIKQLSLEGKGVMFITHDICAALQIADKIAVFYAGQTVEIANVEDFSGGGEKLRHPYTKALWNALPQNGFIPLAGSQPMLGETYSTCGFLDRCPFAMEKCFHSQPQNRIVRGGMVRCFNA